ncbi:hypothetical protein [Pseudomonas sp. 8BK]|uniref:hypothetical protein n=1 Tax=Pseudomonas sp. 8BK TaxID=2653164 RepID=UPI001359E74E|nr:hypothetical protein [Pseudomonas sp. 8BK]
MLQAPTDSLYKFLAIAGLLLIGLSAALGFSHTSSYLSQTSAAGKALNEIGAELIFLKLEFAPYIRAAKNVQQGIPVDGELLELPGTIKSKVNELQRKIANGQVLVVDIGIAKRIWLGVLIVCGFLFLFGFALSAIGFRLWYLRIQRYLDIDIKNQSEKNSRKPYSLNTRRRRAR